MGRADDLAGRKDRAIGSLLGLAVGDAVGTTLEFKARDSYPPLHDMVGGGAFKLKAGEWTDDTSMALCLADSLIACGELDESDLMQRFVRWWRNGENGVNGERFDIGNTTLCALATFERTGNPQAGSRDPDTAGNGSLMRLAPIVIRHHADRAKAIDGARRQSATTHGAPAAIDACALFAELLLDAIAGTARDALLAPRKFEGRPEIAAIAQGRFANLGRDAIASSGYVVHTLEAALWSIRRSATFREAVLLAANLGEDADTVAAVTGQLAGALWGESGVPEEWLGRLAWRDSIRARALRLFEMGCPG
jgi:ADP-ribosyl-[dinitrogen reductase] hydrolase